MGDINHEADDDDDIVGRFSSTEFRLAEDDDDDDDGRCSISRVPSLSTASLGSRWRRIRLRSLSEMMSLFT